MRIRFIAFTAFAAIYAGPAAMAISSECSSLIANDSCRAALTAFNHAVDFLNKGDADHAIASLTDAIRSDAKDADAFDLRGVAYATKGDGPHALADFAQAIMLKPKGAGAYADRGNYYRSQSDFDRALADFNKAVEVDPKSADAYTGRAILYRDLNDTDNALADFSKAIDLNSKATENYLYRGDIYLDKADYEHALADYSRASSINSKLIIGPQSSGLIHFANGQLPDAESDFQKLASNSAGNYYGPLGLALVRAKMGKANPDLEKSASGLDLDKWPGPLIAVFLGKKAPDDIPPIANKVADPATKNTEICEATFYMGEYQLIHGDAANGKKLLGVASSSGCAAANRTAAAIELKKIP